MTTVRDIMTKDPIILDATESTTSAAERMASANIGDVLVERDGTLCGIVTDRDIVIRAVAQGKNPAEVRLEDVCSSDLITVGPDDDAGDVIRRMRDSAIRRMPVVQDGTAIGVLSIGDLAMRLDDDSLLAAISEAPADS